MATASKKKPKKSIAKKTSTKDSLKKKKKATSASQKTPFNQNAFSLKRARKASTNSTEPAPPLQTMKAQDSTAAEIIKRLRELLSPTEMTLKNTSGSHETHKEGKKHGGGHYEVFIVSTLFEGLSALQRQQWVLGSLKDLFEKKIHALSMKLKSPKETKLKP